jgi:hypothetical protein
MVARPILPKLNEWTDTPSARRFERILATACPA